MYSLEASLGVLLLGIFFNTFLYGLVSAQYASYYNTKFEDPAWIKYLVLILFLLDTFHSASVIYMAWVICVENFTNPFHLLAPVWPYPLTVLITSVTAFLVQVFLSYRIYRLTDWKTGSAALFMLSLSSLVVGSVCGAGVWKVDSPSQVPSVRPLVIAWLCLKVGVDALITGILSCVLAQSRTGFCRSDTMINRLIRASVQTGLLTGIFSILSLILFLKYPKSHLYGMLGIPIGRIYTNTLMDTLLVRHSLREMALEGKQYNSITTNAIWMFVRAEVVQMRPMGNRIIQLHIHTEVFTDARSSHSVPHIQLLSMGEDTQISNVDKSPSCLPSSIKAP